MLSGMAPVSWFRLKSSNLFMVKNYNPENLKYTDITAGMGTGFRWQ